jgi:hypothetical protein
MAIAGVAVALVMVLDPAHSFWLRRRKIAKRNSGSAQLSMSFWTSDKRRKLRRADFK